ncbi:hypothetical protein Pelo_7852 [Pelomyxa schiedti]|nr:hypothetical protein Pelo_7852 [Pelomyxa schiedti]
MVPRPRRYRGFAYAFTPLYSAFIPQPLGLSQESPFSLSAEWLAMIVLSFVGPNFVYNGPSVVTLPGIHRELPQCLICDCQRILLHAFPSGWSLHCHCVAQRCKYTACMLVDSDSCLCLAGISIWTWWCMRHYATLQTCTALVLRLHDADACLCCSSLLASCSVPFPEIRNDVQNFVEVVQIPLRWNWIQQRCLTVRSPKCCGAKIGVAYDLKFDVKGMSSELLLMMGSRFPVLEMNQLNSCKLDLPLIAESAVGTDHKVKSSYDWRMLAECCPPKCSRQLLGVSSVGITHFPMCISFL